MKKLNPVQLLMTIRKNIVLILIACVYYGFLAYTLYQKISDSEVTESIIQLAVIEVAFGILSYVMYSNSYNCLKKRHVLQNTKKELEITKKRILYDRSIAVLFLIAGIILMLLAL